MPRQCSGTIDAFCMIAVSTGIRVLNIYTGKRDIVAIRVDGDVLPNVI